MVISFEGDLRNKSGDPGAVLVSRNVLLLVSKNKTFSVCFICVPLSQICSQVAKLFSRSNPVHQLDVYTFSGTQPNNSDPSDMVINTQWDDCACV